MVALLSFEDRDISRGVQDLTEFIGRRGPVVHGRDRVSSAMIRHWCEVIGDANPAYREADGPSRTGPPIAPPAMLQVWTMPGFEPGRRSDALTEDLYARLDQLGYSAIVATDSEQDYLHPLRPGDSVAAVRTIVAISGEKNTKLGPGVFVTSMIEVTNGAGAIVGKQLHRVLKFRPQPAPPAIRTQLDPGTTPDPPGRAPAGPEEASIGTTLAPIVLPITRRFIVAAAIVSRDFEDIHHDPDAARRRGAQDIFTNVITTNGLTGRLATDWAGPRATLRRIAIKLGGQNYPGDTLTLTGTVARRHRVGQGWHIGLDVIGYNERGIHVRGAVEVEL